MEGLHFSEGREREYMEGKREVGGYWEEKREGGNFGGAGKK